MCDCLHVLFFSAGGSGGHMPLAYLAAELQRRGHFISYVCSSSMRLQISKVMDQTGCKPGTLKVLDDGMEDGHMKLKKNGQWPFGDLAKIQRPLLIDHIRQLHPPVNAAVIDYLSYAGASACVEFSIPYALNVPGTSSNLVEQGGIRPAVGELLTCLHLWTSKVERNIRAQVWHFGPKAFDCASAVICQSFGALEHRRLMSPSPKVHLSGPLVPHAAASVPENVELFLQEAPGPVVYVSTGSIPTLALSNTQAKQLFEGLRLGVEGKDRWRVIWVMKAQDRKALPDLPAGFLALDWAPQKDMIAHPAIAALVYHMGWNGFQEAVQFGKPVLAVPMVGDQPTNAEMAQKLGMGIKLYQPCPNPADTRKISFTADDVVEKLRKLLAPNSPYRKSAERLSATVMATSGVEGAADLVQSKVVGTAPGLPRSHLPCCCPCNLASSLACGDIPFAPVTPIKQACDTTLGYSELPSAGA